MLPGILYKERLGFEPKIITDFGKTDRKKRMKILLDEKVAATGIK